MITKNLKVFFFTFFLIKCVSAPLLYSLDANQAVEKLASIHSKLQLKYGSFNEEYPEQLMTVMFLPNNAKVLELGGNIGRNSCVIASILSNQRNLVSVESDEQIARQLKENKEINKLNFGIVDAAISKVPLVQAGWKTIPSNEDLPGYKRIKTISFSEVEQEFGIKFDTLIVDCEGALFYILRDPDILKNIRLVIIENDFDSIDQMNFVQQGFINNGLQCVYNQAYIPPKGGWRPNCCANFYQVWKK